MFYLVEVEDHVRVEPRHFGLPTKEAVERQLNESYVNHVRKELGYVMSVVEVKQVSDGIIIPGDGAPYYKSAFSVVAWKPELHELDSSLIQDGFFPLQNSDLFLEHKSFPALELLG